MAEMIIFNPTHDDDYYIAKRNELQARLDKEVLRAEGQLKHARRKAKQQNIITD